MAWVGREPKDHQVPGAMPQAGPPMSVGILVRLAKLVRSGAAVVVRSLKQALRILERRNKRALDVQEAGMREAGGDRSLCFRAFAPCIMLCACLQGCLWVSQSWVQLGDQQSTHTSTQR